MSEMASAPPAAAALAIVGDARHVRRQLGDDRRRGRRAAIGHEPLAHRRIGAEIDAARHVRARDVQLDRRDAGQAVEPARHPHELVVRAAGDADDDRHAEAAKVRQVMRDEGLDAVVIEADRVEHAGRRFDRSPRRVAGARLLRDRLRQDAAQAAKIDQALPSRGRSRTCPRRPGSDSAAAAGRAGRRDRSVSGCRRRHGAISETDE